MKNRLILTAPSIFLALLILLVSIFRTTSVKLALGYEQVFDFDSAEVNIDVDYELPNKLEVYPDSIFWNIKAIEDSLVLKITSNPIEKARLMRTHSDERLVAAVDLLESGDVALGMSYLFKSEDYLFNSFSELRAPDAIDELKLISLASLKHRVILEEILIASPESLRPEIVSVLDKSKLTYIETEVLIKQLGDTAPDNPFDQN